MQLASLVAPQLPLLGVCHIQLLVVLQQLLILLVAQAQCVSMRRIDRPASALRREADESIEPFQCLVCLNLSSMQVQSILSAGCVHWGQWPHP